MEARQTDNTGQTVVAALYHFAPLDDIAAMRADILATATREGIRGTLLLAHEGVNGTISGTRAGIDAMLAFLRDYPELSGLEHKESYSDGHPFHRMKVRLKKEIVTLGKPEADPTEIVGEYVAPEDWNNVISDPDTVLVDTRNDYEVAIGTFEGAQDPHTEKFRDFPDWVERNLDPERDKKVAMFCTGGIRCEKASSYLKKLGFENVYHLQGGILKYLEEVPEEHSLWRGDCFVFDQRVAVKHGLEQGEYAMCFACRHPVSDADMDSPHYIEGVSCPHCHDKMEEEQKKSAAERMRQVKLAEARGEDHIGRRFDTAETTAPNQKDAKDD